MLGQLDSLMWGVIFLLAAYFLSNWAGGIVADTLAQADVQTIAAYESKCGYRGCGDSNITSIDLYGLRAAKWGILVVLGLLGACSLLGMCYCATGVCTVYVKGERGSSLRYSATTFPLGSVSREIVFDQIIEMKVTQTSLQRMTDTGDIEFKFLMCDGFKSTTDEFKIEGVEHPFSVRDDIASVVTTAPPHRLAENLA